ncbi:pilus assembly protein TadG-related protein [Pengzhenrongella sicca]|uniref:Pilus assembly protein n=1 Tax=Pengzhenrongella sicca TaxID=2819238 RepID=A0A8A4ZHQ3_9MICO|nr:pilus assembly protein TadG-related protein [Pengzhenrongella sicca]QTE30047.1 pilus assembly protein [Pengzhenrongella sicca]
MTVFVVIVVVGILLLAGLVADGGAKLRATQRADAVAAEAARAGGQVIDQPDAIADGTVVVDRQGAATAAQAYLAANNVSGTVVPGPDRSTLVVTVAGSSPTAFLGLIGIESLPVTGQASITLVHGVSRGGP